MYCGGGGGSKGEEKTEFTSHYSGPPFHFPIKTSYHQESAKDCILEDFTETTKMLA